MQEPEKWPRARRFHPSSPHLYRLYNGRVWMGGRKKKAGKVNQCWDNLICMLLPMPVCKWCAEGSQLHENWMETAAGSCATRFPFFCSLRTIAQVLSSVDTDRRNSWKYGPELRNIEVGVYNGDVPGDLCVTQSVEVRERKSAGSLVILIWEELITKLTKESI